MRCAKAGRKTFNMSDVEFTSDGESDFHDDAKLKTNYFGDVTIDSESEDLYENPSDIPDGAVLRVTRFYDFAPKDHAKKTTFETLKDVVSKVQMDDNQSKLKANAVLQLLYSSLSSAEKDEIKQLVNDAKQSYERIYGHSNSSKRDGYF